MNRPAMTRFEAVRDEVLAHPLHRTCGLRLHHAGEGESEVEIELNDFTLNPEGSLHGGMLYTFFDVACFFACLTLLEADKHPVSIETHTSVLRAASKGDRVLIRARVDRLGRTLAAMRADALALKPDGTEKLIATGSVTKSIIGSGPA